MRTPYRAGIGFYSLRRTFETVAADTLDQPAIDLVMGHTPHTNEWGKIPPAGQRRTGGDRVRPRAEVVVPSEEEGSEENGEEGEVTPGPVRPPGERELIAAQPKPLQRIRRGPADIGVFVRRQADEHSVRLMPISTQAAPAKCAHGMKTSR